MSEVSDTYDHSTWLSPFTWRYGSSEMRSLWSDFQKRRLWRRLWVALAEAQQKAGLVTEAQVLELRACQDQIDLPRAQAIEAEIHHDLMAELRTFAEQCPTAGGIIHLGATSMDIEDNADALRLREALGLVQQRLRAVLSVLADLIEREAHHICMGFTHLQPAEPTTIGYRLAGYAQDLLADDDLLSQTWAALRGKGLKGAVGTSAAYEELLAGSDVTPADLEKLFMQNLALDAFPIATQTYTRRQDWQVLNVLASLAMTLYRLAFDLRLLQSPPIGEWSEPFAARQVGSSAMPFKRNPIHAENIDSLARYLAALPRVAWDNGAHNLLERTLDDSANRRLILPEAFLAADELLLRAKRILDGLQVDVSAVARNLQTYGLFAATERLLMVAVRAGGDRQALHERIREHSIAAWEAIRRGQPNPLRDDLLADKTITALVNPQVLSSLLDASAYVGNAPERALTCAEAIRIRLSDQ